MKTQMRVQKILMLVSLVVSALVFVYALFFMTGGLADVYRYIDEVTGQDYINCAKFVSTSGDFVSALVALGIVLIVLVVVMYLMASNSRRKYYITNYVSVALFVVMAAVVAIYMFAMVGSVMNLYQNDILWKEGEGQVFSRLTQGPNGYEQILVHGNYAEMSALVDYADYPLDPNQSYNFILGFIMAIVVLADAVCVCLCTVWKFLLVKGENKLLAAAPAAENAGVTAEAAVAEATEPAAEEIAVPEAPAEEPVDSPVKEEE